MPCLFGLIAAADFLITAHGLKPRSQLMAAFRPDTVDAAGFVKVKATMQLLTKDGSLDHIFAVGDVNDADVSVLQPRCSIRVTHA